MKVQISLGVLQAISFASAVTVYPTNQAATGTAAAAAADYTGAAAYNPTVLNPPAVPSGLPTQFVIQLQNGGTNNLSLPQNGSFIGFSIEMSVVNQVLGSNSKTLQVPFLNLMANLQERSGRVNIRVGGNTQETAVLVESTSDGKILEKNITGSSNPTQTPPLIYTPDLLYMMGNISALVNVHWFVGIPFLLQDTATRLAITQRSQEILGDHLMGIQVGNEPDLYQRHQHYTSYGPYDYFGDFGVYVQAMQNANLQGTNLLVGPNIAYADWTTEQVWDTGFVGVYSQNLAYLSVENYPTDNCAAQFNTGGAIKDPQTIFPDFLSHTSASSGHSIIQKFLNSSAFAVQNGKRLVMFETNTASCGGFAGISDAFGAALWGIDYAFQMAFNNFGGAMIHVGGQNVFYNTFPLIRLYRTPQPFTPPPTNQSTFHQWTVGPTYYAALVAAESIGPSNATQLLDLGANGGNVYTPAYAFYENSNPVRVGIINYVTDPTGASDLRVQIAIGGSGIGQPNQSPASVKVKWVFNLCAALKYLLADSVSQKGNFTWAGQTFGDNFASDGRPMGQENITTIACDSTTNLCTIPVPAPSYALVYLTDAALDEPGVAATTTFPTTVETRTRNTVTIDQAVLATSNGGYGKKLGSTSAGSTSGAAPVKAAPGIVSVLALASGLLVLARMMGR
ncbi:hypothetical protein H0H87_011662 [Tephrocybe sp. NHM501043]|nr:hypothetical protein H0H87_011662 [Tephrocybe sp. NHM501043]